MWSLGRWLSGQDLPNTLKGVGWFSGGGKQLLNVFYRNFFPLMTEEKWYRLVYN